jgi:hypothetical protein
MPLVRQGHACRHDRPRRREGGSTVTHAQHELGYAAGIIDGEGWIGSSGVHQWRLTAGQAAEFCRQVRPYLKMKHRQAQLLVEYREDPRLDHTRHGGQGVRTPEAEVAVKHEYKAAFGVLNKRGVPARR